MKNVRNKTQEPLAVPLPENKTLHLKPLEIGQVSDDAPEHPAFQELVEAGKLEILGHEQVEQPGPEKKDEALRAGKTGRVVGDTHTSGADR